uniref:SGL domain-containing protein n=1 Tax=Panagrellus redivivus TaxID=6233 RepID=A0A7E4URA2_PANRE
MLQILVKWLCTLWVIRGVPIGGHRVRLGLAFVATLHAVIILQMSDFSPANFPDWPHHEVVYRGALQAVKKQLDGDVVGMESLAYHAASQKLYGGTRDGWIVEISISIPNVMEIVGKYPYGNETRKRRPLGMRFSPTDADSLVFLDAYQGIFRFDVSKKEIHSIYSNPSTVNLYLNDFDFLSNGDLIISQPCTTESDSSFHRIVLASQPSGRLLRWSRAQQSMSIVADGLYAPNGVQASPDRKSIIFAEMMAYRLNKVVFDEESGAVSTIRPLIEGLPGMPDNIRLMDDNITLIVPLPEDRLELPWFLNYSFVKYYMLWVYETFFHTSKPHIGEFAAILFVHSETGKIVDAWDDPSGEAIGGITQVTQIQGKQLVFGTDTAPCLFITNEFS